MGSDEMENDSCNENLIKLRSDTRVMDGKAVLFDLDGVLTGTSNNHFEAWSKLINELGYELPLEFRDKLRGISRMESLNSILRFFNLHYSIEEKTDLTVMKNQYYKESIANFSEENLYPGVEILLEKLKHLKIKTGLVSSSKNALNLVKIMKIEKYFNIILDPETVKKGKPYPDPFLVAAQLLNVCPENCLGIEDAVSGIKSINSAGMTSIGIGGEDLSEADYLYNTIEQSSEFILNWVVNNKEIKC